MRTPIDLKTGLTLLSTARKQLVEAYGATAALALGVAILSVGIAEAAGRAPSLRLRVPVAEIVAELTRGADDVQPMIPAEIIWTGVDLDGDGRADLANPTGRSPRVEDAYGRGEFHASRDGGARRHQGVDYVADAGQAVAAPISGFVTKIGFAYAGDGDLRFVEIDNPALKVAARVFYVDPQVEVGDAVEVGRPIGTASTLQHKYPGGITDHVHLEIEDGAGRKLDAARLIFAQAAPATVLAAN